MIRNSGMTLLEVIVAMALLSLLLAAAAPSLSGIIEQRRGDEAIRLLGEAIELTRAAAIGSGSLATLCRSGDGASCGGRWEEGMIVFIDGDGNRVPDTAGALVRVFRFPSPTGNIRWRSFGNRQYLQMTPMGFTRNQNGNFTWCPSNGDVRLARQLIVNAAGRMREALDNDGDGVREGANGRPIACD
ncbi:MAG: prepilin-type N-terminal cleavage/methylation domain-containing protein [Gammaproteobacteria bacterium]|nr:prepilin-type N-terminal cleavage/methylation domain-containing protein [Gammaproteobacteria bacterium]MYC59283.1 prepilin-type N-terminal cleavage/methylation domain-containing protein [Gammaproteobacteria bacterium]MYE98982.1 prepilin-type N-terminal cleavage/methylation domain-containing protein [Gammaproteobacteria bacterium]MYG96271.1 prepilin-type N-terminal cleavage/methylation domain-containing protein [Gammaproteobacteria bacterium]